jgi:SAM-dependent methyltransferase
MRDVVKEFVSMCAAGLPIVDPVYEFGSLQVSGQEGFADLRPFFAGKRYVGADMREGPGVDVILDVHSIDLSSESVGSVLMLDTLEHVEFPKEAVREVHRILKPDGIFIASSVMNFPIHAHPNDYWRFTPEGFRSLLKPFASVVIDCAGEEKFPHTVVGIGFKGSVPEGAVADFRQKFGRWKEYWSHISERRWKKLARLTVSPIRVDIYRKVRAVSR